MPCAACPNWRPLLWSSVPRAVGTSRCLSSEENFRETAMLAPGQCWTWLFPGRTRYWRYSPTRLSPGAGSRCAGMLRSPASGRSTSWWKTASSWRPTARRTWSRGRCGAPPQQCGRGQWLPGAQVRLRRRRPSPAADGRRGPRGTGLMASGRFPAVTVGVSGIPGLLWSRERRIPDRAAAFRGYFGAANGESRTGRRHSGATLEPQPVNPGPGDGVSVPKFPRKDGGGNGHRAVLRRTPRPGSRESRGRPAGGS